MSGTTISNNFVRPFSFVGLGTPETDIVWRALDCCDRPALFATRQTGPVCEQLLTGWSIKHALGMQ